MVARELIHLHEQDVDERIEPCTTLQRILHRHHLRPEALHEAFHRVLIVRLFMVELVEGNDHRLAHTVYPAGEDFGTHLNAVLCVHDHERRGRDAQGGKHRPHKVVSPGGVDDIELAVHKLGIERGRIDGLLVKLLNLRIVRDGILSR